MILLPKSSIITKLPAKDMFDEVTDTRREEKGMSPFIAEHISEISEITGYDLEVIATEEFVGPFRADIVCRDVETDEVVVIENQFDDSDHDHLGKCITYMANLNAKAVVWINENFRPEHKKAIEWLNENMPDDMNFYGLTLVHELIGNQHTYSFERIVVPTNVNKLASQIKSGGMSAESKLFADNYWAAFVEKLNINSQQKFKHGKQYGVLKIDNNVTLVSKYLTNKRCAIIYFEHVTKDNDTFDFEQYIIDKQLSKKFGKELIIEHGVKSAKYQQVELCVIPFENTVYDVIDEHVREFENAYNKLK